MLLELGQRGLGRVVTRLELGAQKLHVVECSLLGLEHARLACAVRVDSNNAPAIVLFVWTQNALDHPQHATSFGPSASARRPGGRVREWRPRRWFRRSRAVRSA